MRDPASFLPLHPNDFQVLFSLVDEPRHGYGIAKEVERESEGRVRIDPANLYRSIKRMVATGLIEAMEGRSATAEDTRRRYYRLTPFGLSVVRLEALRLRDLAQAATTRRLIPKERTP